MHSNAWAFWMERLAELLPRGIEDRDDQGRCEVPS